VSVVNTTSQSEELALKRTLFSPESPSIVDGRPLLYDAFFTSSNGETSCSSCHIFGDFDSLAWDLGNPDDSVLVNQNPVSFNIGQDPDFHPMKGPMTTQSLRGMANHGPMHWRGDRTGGLDEPNAQPNGGAFDEDLAFKKFNPAFVGLLGRDAQLSAADMQAFTSFILQVTYPPNPVRALDNSLTPAQLNGRTIYFGPVTDAFFNCNQCHALNPAAGFFGTDGRMTFENEPQLFKIAHLRNLYQKVGMFGMAAVPFLGDNNNVHTGPQVRGFGFLHDGGVDTIRRFHSATVFSTTPAEEADLEAFMFAFDSNLAPVVGQQVTLNSVNVGLLPVSTRLNLFEARAAAAECDVIAKGLVGGQQRGWYRIPSGDFRSDRTSEPLLTSLQMRLLGAVPGQDLTYTAVPPGAGERAGVDRDEDGFYDRDELDAGSDPADPLAVPGGTTAALVPAKKIQIKNKLPDDESKNKIVVLTKSSSITTPAPLSGGDPRCNADPVGTIKATLTIASTISGESHTADLPCENWALLGSSSNPKGYKYRDPELDDGTVKKLTWKHQTMLKAILQGKGPSTLDYDLTVADQGTVGVQLTVNGASTCMACDDYNGKNGSDEKLFLGKDCPAPASCVP